jgi:hypothetical protein
VAKVGILSRHFTAGTGENHEKTIVSIADLRSDIWTRGPAEYEAEMLTTTFGLTQLSNDGRFLPRGQPGKCTLSQHRKSHTHRHILQNGTRSLGAGQ